MAGHWGLIFFKVVFYHLLDFSKKRTWVIVIDIQLIETM